LGQSWAIPHTFTYTYTPNVKKNRREVLTHRAGAIMLFA